MVSGDVFVLASIEVILLISLNIKNTLGASKVFKIFSLPFRPSFTPKFLAWLGVEHLTAAGPLLLESFR